MNLSEKIVFQNLWGISEKKFNNYMQFYSQPLNFEFRFKDGNITILQSYCNLLL